MGEGTRSAKARKEGATDKKASAIMERMSQLGRGRHTKQEAKNIDRGGKKFKNLTERQKGTTGMGPPDTLGKMSKTQLAYLKGVVSRKTRKGSAMHRVKQSAQLMLDAHAKAYPKPAKKKTAKKKTAKATQRKTTKRKTTKRKTAKKK